MKKNLKETIAARLALLSKTVELDAKENPPKSVKVVQRGKNRVVSASTVGWDDILEKHVVTKPTIN